MPDRKSYPSQKSDRTILCVARKRAGRLFIEEALKLGCRVWVLTEDSQQHETWPEGISGVVTVWNMDDRHGAKHVARELAAKERIDRIVALLERDVEVAAEIREMLWLGGQPTWQAQLFRDKLAMRMKALAVGVRVPFFAPAADREAVGLMMDQVSAPYVLKIRDGLGAANITRYDDKESAWRAIDGLGDQVERYLIEQYIPGDVYHVDSVSKDGTPRFAIASRYGLPLLDVIKGGNFVSYTIERGSDVERRLLEANRKIIEGFGFERGITHIEFIVGREDGEVYFLEGASRMASAKIPWVIDQATGVCLYHEWARLEAFDDYEVSRPREGYAGIIVTVPKHGPADLSAYDEPAVVWKSTDPYLPGLILRSEDARALERKMLEIDRQFAAF